MTRFGTSRVVKSSHSDVLRWHSAESFVAGVERGGERGDVLNNVTTKRFPRSLRLSPLAFPFSLSRSLSLPQNFLINRQERKRKEVTEYARGKERNHAGQYKAAARICVSTRFSMAILSLLVVCFSIIVGDGRLTWNRTTDAWFHHHWTKNVSATPTEWWGVMTARASIREF